MANTHGAAKALHVLLAKYIADQALALALAEASAVTGDHARGVAHQQGMCPSGDLAKVAKGQVMPLEGNRCGVMAQRTAASIER